MTDAYLDGMTLGFLDAVAWLPVTESGEDTELSREDFDADAISRMREDCEGFLAVARDMGADPETADIPAAQCGHDFYLTRARHGAGFWDRGLGDTGRVLTEAAHTFSEDTGALVALDGTVEYTG